MTHYPRKINWDIELIREYSRNRKGRRFLRVMLHRAKLDKRERSRLGRLIDSFCREGKTAN